MPLIIGAICLGTAFTRGDSFCMGTSPSLHQNGVKEYSPVSPNDPHLFGHRRLLDQGPDARAVRRLLAEKQTQHRNISASEVPVSWKTGTNQLKQESNQTSDESNPGLANSFVGPNGWVITWLKVEGFFVLVPVTATIMERLSSYNLRSFTIPVIGLSGLLQTIWVIVGLVWIWGGYVPEECRDAEMGDKTAYSVMWWVCNAHLVLALCALPGCCLMFCCVYYPQKDSLLNYFESNKRGNYTSVDESFASPKSYV